jgi:hypothetical protein
MSYTIQAVIAKSGVLPALLPAGLERVQLQGGFELVPLTSGVRDTLGLAFCPLTDGGDEELTPSLVQLCERLSASGELAYIEAEIFGGSGMQGHVLFAHSKAVGTPVVTESAINVALARLGAERSESADEFEMVGLGKHRDTDSWTVQSVTPDPSFKRARQTAPIRSNVAAENFVTMTTVDFKAHLRKQIGFLARSCEAFDAGHVDESIRIATIVRVLVHQTKNSTSLFKHLNATTINLLSTTKVANPRTVFAMNMGTVTIGGDGITSYYPSLGEAIHKELVPVSKWWDQVIIVSHPVRLSRRNIVLGAANNDGGAHVAAVLEAGYKEMKDEGFMNMVLSTSDRTSTSRTLENTHLVCLRQMGYELLHSPQLLELAAG